MKQEKLRDKGLKANFFRDVSQDVSQLNIAVIHRLWSFPHLPICLNCRFAHSVSMADIELMTPEEVCRVLAISKPTLWRLKKAWLARATGCLRKNLDGVIGGRV